MNFLKVRNMITNFSEYTKLKINYNEATKIFI